MQARQDDDDARVFRGAIQAVLLDWAGTTMDFGCMAPAVVFVEVFEHQGVPITMAEARAPMGAHKKVHIQRITEIDAVRARWRDQHGREPDASDVERMFADFVPRQLACLGEYTALIPGTVELVDTLRTRDIKIGSTTGYTTEMTAINLAGAAAQGYAPDSTVSASEVVAGRPYPYMCLRNAVNLRVDTVHACVKVDDTVPGVHEGLNAGMWSVGLAISGNEVGLPRAEWEALSGDEQHPLRARAYERMRASGAHYVVDSIAELLPCIDDIQARIRAGERP